MKIGINATCLNDRPSGAKHRFLGIYGALFKSLPDVEFAVFEPRDCRVAGWFAAHDNVSKRVTPVPSLGRVGKFAAGLGYWRHALSQETFDLFEAMHLPLVRPTQGVSVLTIHDLRGLHSDNNFMQRTLFAAALHDALKRADHVVTVSSVMRAEILAFRPHSSVSVVYNGIDATLMASISEIELDAFLKKYKLPRGFLLAVGHLEGRKNYARLIDAMALLKQRGLDYPLVIIGNDSGEGVALVRRIAALNLGQRITLLSGISDDEVRCAYLQCGLLVFPSSYEGFGIPILEAMAAGRPIVLSDIPIFREITENGSVYFDQNSVESIADAIEVGLSSQDVRQSMVEYGLTRVKNFSFDRLAHELAGVYRVYL